MMDNSEFRSGAIDAAQCLSEGWNLVKTNYGIFLAMVFVELVIVILVGLIPYVGGIINAVIAGILLCGIYFALLNQYRGTPATFSMMFEMFSRPLPAVLIQLTMTVPLLVLPAALFFLNRFTPGLNNQTGTTPNIFATGFTLSIVLMSLLFYLLLVIAQLLLFFALPLIADRNLGFVEAVRLSVSAVIGNVGGLLLLFLLEFLVMLVGMLALCIGIFFVMPVIYAANIIAYRSVFPDYQTPFNNEPPRPDAYGSTYGTPTQTSGGY